MCSVVTDKVCRHSADGEDHTTSATKTGATLKNVTHNQMKMQEKPSKPDVKSQMCSSYLQNN